MRFALLGYDDDVLNLTRAALEAGHELAAVFEVDDHPAELPRALDDVPQEAWENLLLGTLADFVIVAHGDYSERRADALRKLVQAAVPLVVVQPACEAIVGFELDMILVDSRGIVVPYSEELFHPLAGELAQLAPSLGRIEQVSVERTFYERTKALVLSQLVRDTGLVRTLLGQIRKVSALGAGDSVVDRLANLSVHMTTFSGTLVRWSAGPASGEPRGTFTVTGTGGQATLVAARDPQGWSLETNLQHDVRAHGAPPARMAIDAIASLIQTAKTQALAGVSAQDAVAELATKPSTWLEACRDVEVAETAERSLLKGKTYELLHEEHSERSTFMGMMAAGGCLLLSVTLVLVVCIAVLGGADISIGKSWPVLLFAVLGGFMLLQLLLLVFRGEDRAANASSASASNDAGKPGQH